VDLATYRLRGEAAQWWKQCREHMEATGGNVTWEGFRTLFLNKYFPSNVTWEECVARFERFEQGLRPEVRNLVITQQIREYQTLIQAC
jgi:hypothetical protein